MKKNLFKSLSKSLSDISLSFANKATPGLLWLGICIIVIWIVVIIINIFYFCFIKNLPLINDLSKSSVLQNDIILITIIIYSIINMLIIIVACILIKKLFILLIPTIKADTESAVLLSSAFGGKILTSSGTWKNIAIGKPAACERTKDIMNVLIERTRQVLQLNHVRSNIFTLNEDNILRIFSDFCLNMEAPLVGIDEKNIGIPNGCLSTGWSFKYYLPVLSEKKNGEWPYQEAENDEIKEKLKNETMKAHPDLNWIVSMPIPYQVEPVKLVCAVLNIDGLQEIKNDNALKKLLPDISTAAALIALLNHYTGFINGLIAAPEEKIIIPGHPENDFKSLEEIGIINPNEFDPAFCPEPSREFLLLLSQIKGLHFIEEMTTGQLAQYLREQLRA